MAILGVLALAPAALAAPAPPPRHLVQPGDTLTSIAQAYASTPPAIAAANGLADPDLILAGQVLVVPPASAPLLLLETRPGDTWAGIARRYRTTAAALQELNGVDSGGRLWVGQGLLVPAPPGTPSPALPPGPLTAVQLSAEAIGQGQTLAIRVQASRPVSLSVQLDGQAVPLRAAGRGSAWGLAAIPVLAEPGVTWLQIDWQDSAGDRGQVLWPVNVSEGDYPTFDIVLPPDKGGLLDPVLTRAEAERLAAIWASPESAPAWTGLFIRPIGDEFVTSAPFGQKRSYNGGPVSSFHGGQDFAAPEGTLVLAPAAGQVVLAEALTVRGNAVIIDHGAGLYTGYWHLSGIEVAAGQRVEAGDPLGLVGTTGLSTGAHLHWEMRLHGIAVSPLQWLSQRLPGT